MKRVQLFETFDIYKKIEGVNENDFTNKAVAIIVPTLDESCRLIKEADRPLYETQQEDARILFGHISSMQEGGSVRILSDGDEINETGACFDHVMLLHEFIPVEQSYIVEGLYETNPSLQVSELY